MAQPETPQLYTYQGDQYLVSDLQKEAEAGFGKFLGTIRRGRINEQEFRNAYYDIMRGISDGSITIENGKFIDSKGRYTNTDKINKNKDYYGIVAYYINDHLGKSKKYEAPKVGWDNNKITKAFNDYIFGEDAQPNLQFFLNLDPIDTKTNKRGTSNRGAKIKSFISNVLNSDEKYKALFGDSSDKQSHQSDIDEALVVFGQDNIITDDEMLALSKVLPGINLTDLLSTEGKKIETPPVKQKTEKEQAEDQFKTWLNQNYGITSQQTVNLSLNNIDNTLLAFLSKPDYDLNKLLINALTSNSDNSYVSGYSKQQVASSILKFYKDNNKLQAIDTNNPNLFYVPQLDALIKPNTSGKREYYFEYDADNGILSKKLKRNNRYFQNQIYNEFKDYNQFGHLFTSYN